MSIQKRSSFPTTTQWNLIVCAGDSRDPGQARKALEDLLGIYWYPIYAFLRRSNFSHAEAEDLAQGFFLYICEHRTFDKADREKGKFRTFIIACLKHFLSDEYDRKTAQKRAGRVIAFDGMTAEARYAAEPVDDLSPERLFERKLATEILDAAFHELESEEASDSRDAAIFAAIRGHLNDEAIETYRKIADRLGMSVTPRELNSRARKLRRRLREILEDRVCHLVDREAYVSSEMLILKESYE